MGRMGENITNEPPTVAAEVVSCCWMTRELLSYPLL